MIGAAASCNWQHESLPALVRRFAQTEPWMKKPKNPRAEYPLSEPTPRRLLLPPLFGANDPHRVAVTGRVG